MLNAVYFGTSAKCFNYFHTHQPAFPGSSSSTVNRTDQMLQLVQNDQLMLYHEVPVSTSFVTHYPPVHIALLNSICSHHSMNIVLS